MIQELGDFPSESWGSFTEILSDIAYCHSSANEGWKHDIGQISEGKKRKQERF